MYLSIDVTGALDFHPQFFTNLRLHFVFVLVCLSIDVTGALVLFLHN